MSLESTRDAIWMIGAPLERQRGKGIDISGKDSLHSSTIHI